MDTTTPARRRTLRRAVGACLAAAIAACLALVAFAAAQGGSGEAQSIAITASGNTTTVTGADGLRPGPTQVLLRGGGPQSSVILARLKPGVEAADVERYLRRAESVPVNLVSIVASGSPPGPGATYRTTVSLAAGTYIATGAARGLGRYATFEVGGVPTGGSLPSAGSSIQMFDHGFRVPRKLDGDGLLRIENSGRNEHFIVGIRLNPGVNPAVVRRQLVAGINFQGPPPGEFVSIIGVVSPGTTNVVQADLAPGVYVIACFYADRASSGREHSSFGMVRQMTVR